MNEYKPEFAEKLLEELHARTGKLVYDGDTEKTEQQVQKEMEKIVREVLVEQL